MNSIDKFESSEDIPLTELVRDHDVVIMKHCFPSSNIQDDIGSPDPSSNRKSLENYKVIYRLLRNEFDKYPDTMFIVWTLPPLHSMATTSANAARATEFSEWLKTDFLDEDGPHHNIYVWDFRGIVMDPATDCLKHKYERDHRRPDSHPNNWANNLAGPQFAQFIVNSIKDFRGDIIPRQNERIVFVHHSTGGNVFRYNKAGLPRWFNMYNTERGTTFEISGIWNPLEGNMPVDYYRSWLSHQ